MTASNFTILQLADRPDLAAKWAELHWRAWGDEPGCEQLSWWVEQASKAVQRTRVPAAFIAVGADDDVLGGVGVAPFDLDERQDRSPWVVGTIVHPDHRGQGVGHVLMARLDGWATAVGIDPNVGGDGGPSSSLLPAVRLEMGREPADAAGGDGHHLDQTAYISYVRGDSGS